MKGIKIKEEGFVSLFTECSVKDRLTQERSLEGKYLAELGIEYKIGDKTTLHIPFKQGRNYGHKIKYLKIVNISEEYFEAISINREEL